MKSFFDTTRQELAGVLGPARAARVYQCVYQASTADFMEVEGIPKRQKALLAGTIHLGLPAVETRMDSVDGTRKYLLRLRDSELVESVVIPRKDRVTFCISSQVGCGLACAFCLTGQMGFIRDLDAGEIVSQVILMRREWQKRTDSRHFSIVFMGMGEPLNNYANVLKAVRIFHDDCGLKVPLTRITISTAGLAPAIERLGAESLFPNISISLTGATNEVRDALMPINRKYPIEQVISAVQQLPLSRRTRVMFEYVVIKGVTDSMEDASRLADLLRGIGSKVNLIPLNPSPDIAFETADVSQVLRFQQVLIGNNIATFIRKNRGNDVSAACGQLRRRMETGRPATFAR
jgi:23S rRNA (adenine2503-C2)-methyltransferase